MSFEWMNMTLSPPTLDRKVNKVSLERIFKHCQNKPMSKISFSVNIEIWSKPIQRCGQLSMKFHKCSKWHRPQAKAFASLGSKSWCCRLKWQLKWFHGPLQQRFSSPILGQLHFRLAQQWFTHPLVWLHLATPSQNSAQLQLAVQL